MPRQIPINGHFKCAQGDIQPAFAQQFHRQRRRTHTGQNHPLRTVQAIGIAHDACVHAKPLQRITHRTQVGAAGIDQCNVVRDCPIFHSMPLVLGNSLPSRRNACRNTRATTLKQASILW